MGFLHSLADSTFAPIILFAALAALTAVLRLPGLHLQRLRIPWVLLSVAITALTLSIAVAYLFLPVLFEDAETNIACIAALAMRGLPVFPAPDAASRYILLYGPLTYLAHVPFYLLFGENLFSFKLLGVLSFIVSLIGIYRICRCFTTPRIALTGLGCASLIFFRYIGVEFWGRIDPVILAVLVVCLWAILEAPVWLVILGTGLTAAIIPNLKVTGVTYLLPVLGLLLITKGWKPAAMASALGAILFPLPFLLPQVSLSNYLFALRAASQHGIVAEFLIRNLQYSILWFVPFLGIRRRPSRDQAIYFALIALGLLATCFLGAKSGAGSYHLIPFIVPILHLYFWVRPSGNTFSRFSVAWVLTMLLLSSTHLQTVVREYRSAGRAREIVTEIRQAERTYKGQTIEVGIGAEFGDMRTRYGYLTTFDGEPYTISGAAIRDLQFGGVEIPESTVRYLEACSTQVWLIPSRGAPFSAFNTYYKHARSAFDGRFRGAFLSHYRKIASGRRYDVWTCAQR